MNSIYIDCSNGVSSDMVFKGLLDLGINRGYVVRELMKIGLALDHLEEHERMHLQGFEHSHDHDEHGHHHSHDHDEHGHHHSHDHGEHDHHDHDHGEHGHHDHDHDGHGHHHEHDHGEHGHHHNHRGFKEIKELIESSELSDRVKEIAINIYTVIAKAESEVHKTTMEDVHFHEVGRDMAIANIVGVAICMDALNIEQVFVGEIHDGKGTIICSHGEIPVPVPAVAAMRKNCDYDFVTEHIDMEMVTPSGLGVLIGIGAKKHDGSDLGKVVRTGVGRGSRNIGRGGLKIKIVGEYQRSENVKKS